MIRNIILISFASLFLVFSFPNFNLSFLAFIGFILLFFAIENKSPKEAFLIFYISGFIFYLGTLYWLYHVTVAGLIILCLYLALYFGVLGLICFRLKAYSLRLIAIPLIWSFLEYIQSHLPIMGFGWLSLGYSQYKNLPLIQIADFSGVYGVSFTVMMVNVAIYRTFKKSFREVIITALVLIAVFGYGIMRVNERGYGNGVRVSVIQGNIPQELKWDPKAQDMIIEKYIALTKMAALESADLIVWPETSFPGFFEIDEDMTEKILTLVKETKIPILIGVNTEKDEKYFNSAALISPEGSMTNKYDKIHLVPFGEYVPFSNKFPAFHKLILGELGEFTPGKDFKAFSLQPSAFSQTVKFSVLICFEDIFPEISRKFVKNGAKFLIVITNDAWYGKSGAAYQHAANSVFRAIENRVPVVRCANTGYSCFIDSRGGIYDSVSEKNSLLFVTGYKTAVVNAK
ncbi:MAG: apolipoprotein N-acyltransferase [Candidatus Omnitrophica bacterium]|nr:apolipoprotein N-acyltransferase [Candidatus Omnitrophota bacterium]